LYSPETYNNYVALINEQHEITPSLVAQLKKDFGTLLETDPDLNANPSIYTSLYLWIFPVIENLYKNDRQRFTALIYSIDAGFIKDKFGKRDENELQQWTHAILLRECLKVFIRNNYKV
jgi:hypothetical protein